MYGWLWRVLPGPGWARATMLLVVAVAIVSICFNWLFPAIAPFMPFNDITVE
jgi:hypothetical protein